MRSSVLLVLSALALSGCISSAGGGPYRIVNRAAVNPAANATRLAIRAPVFDGMTIYDKPLPAWEAGRTPEQLASFAEDKRAFNEFFLKGITEGNSSFDTSYVASFSEAQPARGSAAVTVQVLFLNPQWVRARITVLGAENATEVVDLQVSPNVDISTFGVGKEMRGGGRMLGLVLVRYLKERSAQGN